MSHVAFLRHAVAMDIPIGTSPDHTHTFFEQLSGHTSILDHDEELWIARDDAGIKEICQLADHYSLSYEHMQLLELPNSSEPGPYVEDYGFTSQAGRTYLYADQIYAFQLIGGEIVQAGYQLEEYKLAIIPDEPKIWIVPAEHTELIHGIARAYDCRLESCSFGDSLPE